MHVLEELGVCETLLAVWVILKGGEFCGRMIARYSKSGLTTYVTFQMFGRTTKSGKNVYGYERLTGYGYDRTGTGIAEILNENRETLKTEYGIELTIGDGIISSKWEQDFKSAGYDVIRVI